MSRKVAEAGHELDPTTGGKLVRRNAAMSLRCANEECNHVVARAMIPPGAFFDVLQCPKCGRASRFRHETDGTGLSIILLPTQRS